MLLQLSNLSICCGKEPDRLSHKTIFRFIPVKGLYDPGKSSFNRVPGFFYPINVLVEIKINNLTNFRRKTRKTSVRMKINNIWHGRRELGKGTLGEHGYKVMSGDIP